MVNWSRFTPADFEYDFELDKLAAHHVTLEEAIECFFSDMNMPRGTQAPSEGEIDAIVEAQADDDSVWEKPVRVHKAKPALVPLPSDLAARAAFFARLHREVSVEDWLRRIIQERIDLEEAAFTGLKRDLAAKNGT